MNRATFDAMVAQYAVKEAAGNGAVSWDGGVRCVLPEVQIGGKVEQDGTPTTDAPVDPVFSEGTTVESNGGGTAVAPVSLLAAVDGSCQSTWDPQTGKGLNWWHDAIELDGSEDWKIYTFSSRYEGFYVDAVMPENMVRNMYWCNQYRPIPAKEAVPYSFAHLWCGVNGTTLYCVAMRPVTFPFYDETLEDCGLSNWKAHLAEHPLKIWVARNKPVEFQTDPQPLVQPKGSGHIIQTGGSIHGCPITAKYVTHS